MRVSPQTASKKQDATFHRTHKHPKKTRHTLLQKEAGGRKGIILKRPHKANGAKLHKISWTRVFPLSSSKWLIAEWHGRFSPCGESIRGQKRISRDPAAASSPAQDASDWAKWIGPEVSLSKKWPIAGVLVERETGGNPKGQKGGTSVAIKGPRYFSWMDERRNWSSGGIRKLQTGGAAKFREPQNQP